MTSLTFFGGISTIGGNCILLEEDDTRILLDNGMSFSKDSAFYKDFLTPRTNNALRDYYKLDLIPKIPGIYGKEKIYDYCYNGADLEGKYLFECDLVSYEDYIKREGKPYISALFITHAHLDHVRNILFMAPQIPIYCSEIPKKMFEVIKDLSDYNFLEYSYPVLEERKSGSYFPGSNHKKKSYQKRNIQIMPLSSSIKIPETNPIFEIKGFPVDHSLPGAMAYEINTRDGKRIVYTGDLRFHGHINEREQSEEFLNRINPNPDVFITEGTRINDNDLVSEQDVNHRIVNLLREDDNLSEKLILATFPWKSISRFLTLYQIAKTINRTLVIQPKLAYTIYHLKTFESLKIDGLLKDNRIKIYLPRKYSMLYSQDDYKSAKYYISPNVEWSKDEQIELYSSIYEEDIMKKAYEINKNPNKYIVHLNFYELNELIDLQPPKGSYFFNLKTEPFDEEGELEEKVLMNWINKFGLEYKKDKFHASGHAPGVQILDMINRVKPEKIIPVHTEINEIFSENFKNAIIPKKGVPYRF